LEDQLHFSDFLLGFASLYPTYEFFQRAKPAGINFLCLTFFFKRK